MSRFYTVEDIPKCPLCFSEHRNFNSESKTVQCSNMYCDFYENECYIELWEMLHIKSKVN